MVRLSSNLLRLPILRFAAAFSIFARTFQTYRSRLSLSSSILFLLPRPLQHAVGGMSSLAADRLSGRINSCSQGSRCAKYQTPTGDNAPEPLGLTGELLLGYAMACSLWDSLQGYWGLLPHPTQRTSITTRFPLPSWGRPFGHREAFTSHLQLSKSSTGHPSLQAASVCCPVRLCATSQPYQPAARNAS